MGGRPLLCKVGDVHGWGWEGSGARIQLLNGHSPFFWGVCLGLGLRGVSHSWGLSTKDPKIIERRAGTLAGIRRGQPVLTYPQTLVPRRAGIPGFIPTPCASWMPGSRELACHVSHPKVGMEKQAWQTSSPSQSPVCSFINSSSHHSETLCACPELSAGDSWTQQIVTTL